MTPRLRLPARVATGTATGVAVLAFGTPAVADEGEDFEQPPGYEEPAMPEIDSNAPGLKLGDGATLADPQVRDIKFVVEDIGNAEPGEGGHDDTDPEEEGEEDDRGPVEEPDEETGGTEVDGGDTREERTGDQRKFVLQTGLLFDENSSELSDESVESLEAVAVAIAEEQPEWVNIFGFTDSQGPYEHGVQLSNERAENTQRALLDLMDDASGITFNINGYSEEYFLYDNDTEEGRERNRRVEISWPTSG